MTNPLKLLITIVIVALIGVGFYFMDYQKKILKIKELDAEIKTQSDELEKSQLIVKEIPNLTAKREELQAALQQKLKEKIGAEDPNDFIPNFMAQIETFVKQVRSATNDRDFDLTSLGIGPLTQGTAAAKPGEAGGAGGSIAQYPTRSFDLNIRAKWGTLIYVLDQMGELKLKRLVTINRITMSPSSSGGSGLSPTLQVSLPITSYLRKAGGN